MTITLSFAGLSLSLSLYFSLLLPQNQGKVYGHFYISLVHFFKSSEKRYTLNQNRAIVAQLGCLFAFVFRNHLLSNSKKGKN